MKHLLLTILLGCWAAISLAQSANDFYPSGLESQQKPIPYPFLREADVVWATTIWKTIDLNEAFNQYFFFPIEREDPTGKISLAFILWNALEAGELPIFEDDELKVPLDAEIFIKRYTKADTITLEIGYDEDDNELYQTYIRPHYFESYEIKQYFLREAWFIGKQDTRQDSRRLALAPVKDIFRSLASGEDIYMGRAPIFWVPMQNPMVRNILARNSSYYDGNNEVGQPSWDYVFVNQLYNAYITRESNRYNRTISTYLTGQDALLEAEAIEERVFNIGEDMWEY